jgi:Protein of unknown function (DUF2490)
MRCLIPQLALAAMLALPANASAADDHAQLWLNQSVAFDLDDDTGIEVDIGQRLRPERIGPDSYYVRLWLVQQLNRNFSVSGGIERRINDGGADETRLLQQVNARTGVLRVRARLEQRFVDSADQTGWRLRTRLGVKVPVTADDRVALVADVEPFFTLRPTSNGGQTGLTTLRTHVGLDYEVTDNLALGFGYLRNQDVIDGGTDRVGHSPLLSLDYSF